MSPPPFITKSQTISGDLFSPSTGSTWPSIVIAYGTVGMTSPFDTLIKDFGKELASNGFLAFVPDYFSSTGTSPTFQSVFASPNPPGRFDRWVEVLEDALPYVQSLASDTAGRSGLVGFSLGSHLALRAAAGTKVKAFVDFFGPMVTVGSSITDSLVANLPSTLIHHGGKDRVVPFTESEQLEKWLIAKSIPYSFDKKTYASDGHAGQSLIPQFGPPDWSAQAQLNSTKSTVAFLKKWVV